MNFKNFVEKMAFIWFNWTWKITVSMDNFMIKQQLKLGIDHKVINLNLTLKIKNKIIKLIANKN